MLPQTLYGPTTVYAPRGDGALDEVWGGVIREIGLQFISDFIHGHLEWQGHVTNLVGHD